MCLDFVSPRENIVKKYKEGISRDGERESACVCACVRVCV